MSPRRVVIAVLSVLLAGCGLAAGTPQSTGLGSVGAQAATITLGGEGQCSHNLPNEVEPGPVSFVLDNRTPAEFDVDVWRLDEAEGWDGFARWAEDEHDRAATDAHGRELPQGAELVAGSSTLPGQDGELTVELEPGTYAFACYHRPSGGRVSIMGLGPVAVAER